MKNVVIVLLFVAGFCLPDRAFAQKQSNCPDIKVATSVSNTTDGQANGKIEFKFEDGSTGDQYRFLINPPGEQVQEGTKEGFKELKAAFYDVYVIDKNGCIKQMHVQVK